MRLVPTALGAKGALFFTAVAVLFLATPYSNLFFLLTAFLAVLGAFGIAAALANVRGVAVRAVQVEPGADGLGQRAVVRLRCPDARRVFGLEVLLEIDGTPHPVTTAPMAGADDELGGEIELSPRGVRPVTAVRLRSRHPFGICRVDRRLSLAGVEAVTWPRPAEFGTDRDGADPRLEAGRLRLGAPRDSVAGLREWRHGDPLRSVHWRATARRGRPIVVERERETEEGLEVVLDRRCDAAELDRALSAATRLLLDADAAQRPLRLRSQGFAAAHGKDGAPIAPTLRWLAAAATLPASAPPPPSGSPQAVRLPSAAAAEVVHA